MSILMVTSGWGLDFVAEGAGDAAEQALEVDVVQRPQGADGLVAVVDRILAQAP